MRQRTLKKKVNSELRPVSARALKSAGDTLRPYLPGASVLDLFAGQGRFGQMALQEGADRVVFVEKDAATAEAIREQTKRHLPNAIVWTRDVFAFLDDPGAHHYDLVFADPPFGEWKGDFADRLARQVARVMAPDSVFLVKNPRRVVLSGPLPGFAFWKQSEFGESALTYYRYEA